MIRTLKNNMTSAKVLRLDVVQRITQRVHIEAGCLESAWTLANQEFGDTEDVCVITDEGASAAWLSTFARGVPNGLADSQIMRLQSGEKTKALETYTELVKWLNARGTKRRSVLFLLGGGMVLDLGGFAGATFMRGIPIVNAPTTLLAQVDAAIGGKVAVNLPTAKNIVGSFYCPKLVVIDPEVVRTQTRAGLADGFAETIKVAIIGSASLFETIERNDIDRLVGDSSLLAEVIEEAVYQKIDLLSPDLFERDLRRALNLGHTLAHPIETLFGYSGVTHGQAVAIGMATVTRYAMHEKMCSREDGARIIQTLRKYGLPTSVPEHSQDELCSRLADVIRIRNGVLNLVVPTRIGKVEILEHADPRTVIRFTEEEPGDAVREASPHPSRSKSE